MCKLLYLGNAIVQFVILTKLFYPEQSAYIKQVMGVSEPAYEDDDENGTIAPVFPKVTFCDFDVRRLGFNQKYALQCALPLNLWHERIYQVGLYELHSAHYTVIITRSAATIYF